VSRFAFIDEEKANYPIKVLCRVLDVARSGYYAWRRRGASARLQTDTALSGQIQAIYETSRGTYGASRIHAEPRATGVRCGRKRMARLMRAAELVGRSRRRRVRTTVTDPMQPPAPNLVARDFTMTIPDRLWVGDITFIPTWEGWLYLAFLLDGCSRRVIGWAMADHLRAELTLAAVRVALTNRDPVPGFVHHTDRGSQYSASAYQAVLATQDVIPSMSRAGDCYDNAVAESFLATLKTELIHRQPRPTRHQA
jgi:putative transposase